jgi:NTP pyrophosphatase (non-canonical NTP hydrolase)
MTFNEYRKKAMKTKKPWDEKNLELAYYGLGLAGEAGEVTEIIKKHLSGIKEINSDHMKREIGDVLWYIAAMTDYFGFDLNEIAQINIDKLTARHGKKWSGYGNREGEGE